MLTAFGALSRNRRCGTRFIQGESLEEIMEDYTVEGIPTAEVAVYFSEKCGLELPIFQAVYDVLNGKISTDEIQMILIDRFNRNPIQSNHLNTLIHFVCNRFAHLMG